VINVSVWAREPTEVERASYAPAILVDCTGTATGPGWQWVDGQWVAPQPVEPSPAE
jgi:hypothetical protein